MTTAIKTPSANGRKIVAVYPYRDEAGELLYEVVRYEPKDFRQRRPDGAGDWTWNLQGVRRVLYRLPELLSASPYKTVFVVEGEKDADNLWNIGLVATTCPQGAGKPGHDKPPVILNRLPRHLPCLERKVSPTPVTCTRSTSGWPRAADT